MRTLSAGGGEDHSVRHTRPRAYAGGPGGNRHAVRLDSIGSVLVDSVEFSGGGGFIGHSYFLSDATIKTDLVALIRDRAKAGDPRRQLVEIKRPFWRTSDASQATP